MMGAGVASVCVLAWLTALSVYDITRRRLPNWLTLPGGATVLAVATLCGSGAAALAGAAALTLLYLVVHLVAPAGMGAGDVKLAIGVGGLTGAFGVDVWVLAAVGAPLLTALVALGALIGRSCRSVPHGPSMCVTAAAAVAVALG
jgi:leader peptidase (prepilin peptidase) / N-methyltransferase